jgi:hypothetical protein
LNMRRCNDASSNSHESSRGQRGGGTPGAQFGVRCRHVQRSLGRRRFRCLHARLRPVESLLRASRHLCFKGTHLLCRAHLRELRLQLPHLPHGVREWPFHEWPTKKKTSTGSTAQADITPPARRCIALLAIRLKGGKPAYPHKSCGGVFRCHPTKGKSTMGFTALQVGMEQPLAGRCIALLAIQLPRGGRPHIRTRAAGDVFSCYPTKGKSTRWERLPVG